MERELVLFTVLPFGFCRTCYVFTKLLCPLFRYWPSGGLKVVVHLDDGLCAKNGEREACVWQASWCAKLKNEWGLAVHTTKLVWVPTHRLIWLGLVVDMPLGHIEVSQSKVIAL